MSIRAVSNLISVTPVRNGLGWVRLDRAVGLGGQPYNDWKFGVSLERVSDHPTAQALQDEALDNAGLDPELEACELAKTWLDIGAKASHDDEGTFGFWRTSGTFRLEHGNVHITAGSDALYTPSSGDNAVKWVAFEVGLDRLLKAVLGIGIAQVEAAESVLRQLDEHGPADWTWDSPDSSSQDPALIDLEQELLTTTSDTVAIPGVGTAHRRRLPALQVYRTSPGYARRRARETHQTAPTFTVPACDVWLVALKEGAHVPSQEAFDAATWPQLGDDDNDTSWPETPRGTASAGPLWVQLAPVAVPIVLAAVFAVVFLMVKSGEDAEQDARVDARVAELQLKMEEYQREGPPPPLVLDVGDATRRGPVDALVTVVEIGVLDSWVSRSVDINEHITSTATNVTQIFLHAVPQNEHQDLYEQAAVAGMCADAQGKFWRYRSQLEASHRPLNASLLRRTAEASKVHLSEWDACVADPTTLDQVRTQSAQFLQHKTGVDNTFLVNGRSVPRSQLSSSIVKALKND